MAAEDATVEVEDDGFEDVEPQIIINTNPSFLLSSYYAATSFLASHGWTVLVVVILLIILWSNIESKVRKLLERRREMKDPVQSDPELLAKRAEQMERARQRMQEKASAILKQEAEKRRELEERRRLEKIEDHDAMKAGRSSVATQRRLDQADNPPQNSNTHKSDKNSSRPKAKPLRSGYNPLTGTSSSSRYRPAPRRTGGG